MATITVEFDSDRLEAMGAREEQILKLWIEAAGQQIEEYLNQLTSRGILDQGHLTILIERFRCEARGNILNREIALLVRGQVDGKPVTFNVNKNLRYKRGKLHTGTFAGGLRDIAVTNTLRAFLANGDFQAKLTRDHLIREPFYAGAVLDLLGRLDRATGRNQSSVSRQWQLSLLLSAFCTLSAALAAAWFADGPLSIKVMTAVLIAPVTFLLTYCISAALMPVAFFDDYAAGRRVKYFVARDDAHKARQTLRIAVLALIGIGVFFVFTYYSAFGSK